MPPKRTISDLEKRVAELEAQQQLLLKAEIEGKRAEEALRKSEARLRGILDNVQDACLQADNTGRLTFASPSAIQMFGYDSAEEMIGLPAEFLYADPRDRALMLDELSKTGRTDDRIGQGRRKDGAAFWVSMNVQVRRNNSGEIIGTEGFIRDINARKRAEEALRETTEHFFTIARCIPDTIWSMDLAGRFTYISPRVEQMYGWTAEECLQFGYRRLVTPQQAIVNELLLKEELERSESPQYDRNRVLTFEAEQVRKDGTTFLAEITAAFIWSNDGVPIGVTGVARDITHRKRTEIETQILRQELAFFSRTATLNELTSSIAHEINQPLAAILTNSQTALRLLQNETPDLEELREIMIDIAADDKRASEVIQSMRSMLKKGGSEQKLLSLNDLVINVLSIVRSEALIKNISVTLDLSSSMPPVQGDRVQLQQVILNLAVNALEAMEGTEGPRQLKIRTSSVQREILIDVSDSGTGITFNTLDSIFDPFFTTKPTGLGMGLPLCRSIVTAHQGRLWAENNADGGATFHMALPTADQGFHADQEKQPEEGLRQQFFLPTTRAFQEKKIRVMLVDDHVIVRKGIAHLLRIEPDFEIVGEAADGRNAVQLAATLSPDAIIMDLVMPELNGVEATRIIHKQFPKIQIFGFSSSEEAVWEKAMLDAGAAAFLTKNRLSEDLINVIRTTIRASSKTVSAADSD